MKRLAKLSDAEYLVHLCMTPAPRPEAAKSTRAQVRKELSRVGMSIAEWSRQHQVNQWDTYQLLYGRNKGTRGKSHRIAVLLDLKDGIVSQAPTFSYKEGTTK